MNGLERFLHQLREKFAGIGYTCDFCDAEIFDYPTHRLCKACESSLPKNDKKYCPKCGRKTVADGVCLDCKRELPKFHLGVAPFVYRGKAAAYVNRLKKGESHLSWYLGEKMAAALVERVFQTREEKREETLLLIPVPLTEKRKTERGYNQAERLAESVCKTLCEMELSAEVDGEILQKIREGEQQKHIGYQARKENARGAYHVHKRAVCRDRTIVLIDDILTTGATGSECAERLLAAGAKEVIFLVAAALEEQK